MLTSQNNPRRRKPGRDEIFLLSIMLALGLIGFYLLAYQEFAAFGPTTEFIPISVNSPRKPNYSADATKPKLPAIRLDLVQAVISDQDPDADKAARFATLQANLLTPVPWLVAPT